MARKLSSLFAIIVALALGLAIGIYREFVYEFIGRNWESFVVQLVATVIGVFVGFYAGLRLTKLQLEMESVQTQKERRHRLAQLEELLKESIQHNKRILIKLPQKLTPSTDFENIEKPDLSIWDVVQGDVVNYRPDLEILKRAISFFGELKSLSELIGKVQDRAALIFPEGFFPPRDDEISDLYERLLGKARELQLAADELSQLLQGKSDLS